MIKICDKKKCTGCYACFNTCKFDAITMQADNEGFEYPVVDELKCTNCGMCEKVCPCINIPDVLADKKKCYACFNKNQIEREVSSSGGVFVLLAKWIIKNDGVVCGASFDKDFSVKHTFATNNQDIYSLVGSKYVQSRVENCYSVIEEYLKQKITVLFVGTTCQVAGLKAFLKREYLNLYCVDFICLGVPSPRVWDDYLNAFFDKDTITLIRFKDKASGWNNFSLRIMQKDYEYLKNGHEDMYFTGYYKQLYSRPSCSDCLFKKINRVSDITLADCWGYSHISPDLFDNKGLSSVIIHSEKGEELFDFIKEDMCIQESTMKDILEYNEGYAKSRKVSYERKLFWDDYEKLSSKDLFEKYCTNEKKETIFGKVLRKLKSYNIVKWLLDDRYRI